MATSYNISGYGFSQGLKLTEQNSKSFGSNIGSKLGGSGASPTGADAGAAAVGRPVVPSGVKPGSTSQSVDKSKSKSYYQGNLTFPSDLGKYYIGFKFFRYDRSKPESSPKDNPVSSIYLPIPSNLVDNTGVSINEVNLGLAGAGESILMPAIEAIGGSDQSPEAYKKAGEAVAKNIADVVSKEGAVYAALKGAQYLPFMDSPSNLAELNFGQTPNPYQALMFKGVQLKAHSFSFRLTPRTETESSTIKNIIKMFKKSMLPEKSQNGYLFSYPDVCDIEFGSNKTNLYKIGRSFLESMSVNYAPTGSPSFFKNSNEPVQVDITLNFKELSPVTRNEVE
jgi:hypothetical protein